MDHVLFNMSRWNESWTRARGCSVSKQVLPSAKTEVHPTAAGLNDEAKHTKGCPFPTSSNMHLLQGLRNSWYLCRCSPRPSQCTMHQYLCLLPSSGFACYSCRLLMQPWSKRSEYANNTIHTAPVISLLDEPLSMNGFSALAPPRLQDPR